MSDAPDRSGRQGESRNENFGHAAQVARVAEVFRNRRNDILEYGGDEYDE